MLPRWCPEKKKRWEGQIFKSRHFTPSNRVVFYFSKADATRLKTGGRQFLKSRHFTLQNRQFKFFKSRRFTPPYRLRRSQLVQKPALRASKPPTAALIFSKRGFAPQICLQHFQFFQSRRFAPQYRLQRSQCFKSRRFAPQNRVRWFQFFQKPALHTSIPPTTVSFFSKAGALRLKTAYGGLNFSKAGVLRLNCSDIISPYQKRPSKVFLLVLPILTNLWVFFKIPKIQNLYNIRAIFLRVVWTSKRSKRSLKSKKTHFF